MIDYCLEQVADYLCIIELALVKCQAKENGETYNKFFGGIGSFKRNWLKQARSKRIQCVHVVISYRLSVVTEDSRRWPHPFSGVPIPTFGTQPQ